MRAAIVFFLTAAFIMSSAIIAGAQNGDYTALYRLYNSKTQDHLYTTDCGEKSDASRNGYQYELVAGYIAARQMRRTTPLYRMLLSNGEHFYTTDYQEMNRLSRDGNKSEGTIGYVSTAQARNTLPFYRIANSVGHFYTTDNQERSRFLQNYGAKDEGVSGYLWTSGANSCDGDYQGGGNYPGNGNSYPVIYAQANYQGPSMAVDRDFAGSRDWDGNPNQIRSIRVPQGWYLVLYDRRDFKGRSYNLSADWTPQPGDYWYNRIKSIKAYQGNPPRQPR